MQIVMIGPPGAGKGTQAKMLAARLSVPHISTGDMLRDQVERKTPIGLVVKTAVEKGELVPDNILLDLVRIKIACADCNGGYVFDGFPRTTFQASWLDAHSNPTPFAVLLELGHDDIIKRCTTRGEGRADDSDAAIVEERIKEYDARSRPVIEYYAGMNRLHRVDGSQSIEHVFDAIMESMSA
jgi:adenylate kinase